MLVLGFGLGHWELILIGGVVVLLFFGRRVPEMMRSLGKGVTQFKKGLREGTDESEGEGAVSDTPLPAPRDGEEDVKARAAQDRPKDSSS